MIGHDNAIARKCGRVTPMVIRFPSRRRTDEGVASLWLLVSCGGAAEAKMDPGAR
jgi:hypothetical protein